MNHLLGKLKAENPKLYKSLLAAWVLLIIYLFQKFQLGDVVYYKIGRFLCSENSRLLCLSQNAQGILWFAAIAAILAGVIYIRARTIRTKKFQEKFDPKERKPLIDPTSLSKVFDVWFFYYFWGGLYAVALLPLAVIFLPILDGKNGDYYLLLASLIGACIVLLAYKYKRLWFYPYPILLTLLITIASFIYSTYTGQFINSFLQNEDALTVCFSMLVLYLVLQTSAFLVMWIREKLVQHA